MCVARQKMSSSDLTEGKRRVVVFLPVDSAAAARQQQWTTDAV